jgi:hypothetical protein
VSKPSHRPGRQAIKEQKKARKKAQRELRQRQKEQGLSAPVEPSRSNSTCLARLLARIQVSQIEQAHLGMIRQLIRSKKFGRYLIGHCDPMAVDGSQKLSRAELWDAQCLERKVRSSKEEDSDPEPKKEYYAYVLEANLALANGMVIALLSEVLSASQGDSERNQQDCEQRAFHRLAQRLKEAFSHLPILWWVNDIEYRYADPAIQKKKLKLHAVVCEESLEEIAQGSTEVVTKGSRHAWISDQPLHRNNVHSHCNLGTRHRWGIEARLLVVTKYVR